MLDEKNGYGLAILAVGAALVVLFAAAGLIGAFGTSIPQELWAAAGALSGALVGLLLPAPKTPPTPVAVAASAASAVSGVHRAALRAAVAKGQTIIDGDRAQSGAVQAAIAQVTRTTEGRVSTSAADPITNAVAQHLNAVDADPKKDQQVMQAAAEAATEALSQQSFVGAVPSSTSWTSWITWIASALRPLLKPLILAIITYYMLRLGIRLSDGAVGYTGCAVRKSVSNNAVAPCATALFQAATAMITLGSTAGGALIGLFAPSPGSGGK